MMILLLIVAMIIGIDIVSQLSIMLRIYSYLTLVRQTFGDVNGHPYNTREHACLTEQSYVYKIKK